MQNITIKTNKMKNFKIKCKNCKYSIFKLIENKKRKSKKKNYGYFEFRCVKCKKLLDLKECKGQKVLIKSIK
jgi:hypothetical protein